jgi:hypothetical protein
LSYQRMRLLITRRARRRRFSTAETVSAVPSSRMPAASGRDAEVVVPVRASCVVIAGAIVRTTVVSFGSQHSSFARCGSERVGDDAGLAVRSAGADRDGGGTGDRGSLEHLGRLLNLALLERAVEGAVDCDRTVRAAPPVAAMRSATLERRIPDPPGADSDVVSAAGVAESRRRGCGHRVDGGHRGGFALAGGYTCTALRDRNEA